MIGYHAVPVIVDARVKGIRDFDERAALEAMVHSANLDHFGLAAYREQGFISADPDDAGVGLQDAGVRLRRLVHRADGRGDSANPRRLRSSTYAAQGWRHLLDPETGFFRARRADQRWLEPFDPRPVDLNYTEANSWQYSLFVPHDVQGLIEALGGDEAFGRRLDDLFSADSETTGRDQADITGLIGQYAHGNEPSHHMAWLYHYAGRPDRSAERVRQILGELYRPTPDGLSGNEDCGQMSSWYVFSAMGLYPVTPCTDVYTIGVPIFDSVTMTLENGNRLEIVRTGSGSSIVGATLNGEPIERSFLRHGEILAGGRLEVRLGTAIDSSWGREERPPSGVDLLAALAAPFLRSASDRFRDTLDVELVGPAGSEIVYALGDGAMQVYSGPFTIDRSRTIRFVARDGQRSSPIVSSYLHRLPNDWKVTSRYEPNSQYTAGGPDSLVDGLRGAANWRMGGWQGYQYSDFEADVDLGETRTLRRVGASFLQEQRSWIWMPAEVIVSVSDDGTSFREVARIGHDVPEDADGVVTRDLVTAIEPTRARYVKVLARNFGAIPRWHLGHPDQAFIFVDELLLD